MSDVLQMVQNGVPPDAGCDFQAGGGEFPQCVDYHRRIDRIRRDGFADGRRETVGDVEGGLGEEAVAGVGEDAAPQLVHIDGNDGTAGFFGEHFQPPPCGAQGARAGELSFREDADDFPGLEGLDGFGEGFTGIPGRDGEAVE